MLKATEPRRILVTGGSGFVGKAYIAKMIAEGHDVTSLGRHADPSQKGVTFAQASLADPASLRAALLALREAKPFDILVHMAVSRHHREFPEKALDLFHVNSSSAAELLEFARTTGIKNAVFGSTGTVYSSTTKSHDDNAAGDAETTFRRPSSYFAASKLFADAMAELYRPYLPISVLRFYAPYGPGLADRMLTDIIDRVRTHRPLTLPQSGTGLAFSALYIDDALAAIEEALAKPWNETVNVASPEVWTIESVGHMIGKMIGEEPRFERTAALHAPRIVPDTKRLQQLMPGRQLIGLEEGVQRMMA